MKNCFLSFALLWAFFGVALSAQAQSLPAAAPRTVAVNAEATLSVQPNTATVSFGIQDSDPMLEIAADSNRRAAAALVKTILALGVDEKDISTSSLQISIEQQYQEKLPPLKSFRVQRVYTVHLADISLLEKLVAAGTRNGANQLMGIAFDSTELKKLRDQARLQAVQNAKEKADAMAAQLGMKLGKPLSITDNSVGAMPSYPMAAKMMMADASSTPGETLPTGQMSVSASVSVVFEML